MNNMYSPDAATNQMNQELADRINRYWSTRGVEAGAHTVYGANVRSKLTGKERDPRAHEGFSAALAVVRKFKGEA